MIGSFTEVKPLFYWVQHILPLVYDDSLSYMELLGKVTKTLNELVENNNLLPDYIMKLIKEYISSGEIEKVLAEVLANYMLNVKFPPKGLTPAVGDGSADDTEAIQGCINYAYQNGGMAVYFPSGAYLTQPLTLNEKVTLFGQDRYTTRIVMKGGATKPLFTGTVDEMSLTGLGFDGNMDIQVNNVNLFTITVNSAIITNCLLTDGYDLLNITVNNELQLDNILFRHAVENALVVGGAGYVQGDNLIFKSLSTLIGKNYIVLNTNKSILEEVKCFGAAPNGVLIGGNSNVVNMWCEACQTPYVDNGTKNTIHVYGASEDEKFTGDVTQYIGGFLNQTVAATKKLVARNVIDTAGGTRQVNTTGNRNETTGGNLIETIEGDTTETVTGNKTVTTNDYNSVVNGKETNTIKNGYEENIVGGKKETLDTLEQIVSGWVSKTSASMLQNTGELTEAITGDKTVKAANSIETIEGDKTLTAASITENATSTYKIVSPDIRLKSENPIMYRDRVANHDLFDSVLVRDTSGDPYDVLVWKDATANIATKQDIVNSKKKKYIFIGDSWNTSDTPPEGEPIAPWGGYLATYLGLGSSDYYNYGSGGSGFVAGTPFLTILQNAEIPDKELITDIIVIGGLNDTQHIAQLYEAIGNFKTYVKANFPNATITLALAQWNTNKTIRDSLRQVYANFNNAVGGNLKVINDAIQCAHNYALYQVDGSHLLPTGTNFLTYNIANAIKGGTLGAFVDVDAVSLTLKNENVESFSGIITNALYGNIISTEFMRVGNADITFKDNVTITPYTPILLGEIQKKLISGNSNNITRWNTSGWLFNGANYINVNLSFYLDYFDLYMFINYTSESGTSAIPVKKISVVPVTRNFSIFDC